MTKGIVKSIVANLLLIEADGPISQNEICLVQSQGVSLRAEVIRIKGNMASAQLFETSRGIYLGSEVVFTGKMLEVELGPGILSKNYDGLQNDLGKMGSIFIKDGEITDPMDGEVSYHFQPSAAKGDKVRAGDWLGSVKENWVTHQIMVPFALRGTYQVKAINKEGDYKVRDTIATLISSDGEEVPVTMTQKWPVKLAIGSYQEKLRPYKILNTGLRVIDTLNPMAEGGTGYIPGPFGTGKTVLQQAIAKTALVTLFLSWPVESVPMRWLRSSQNFPG